MNHSYAGIMLGDAQYRMIPSGKTGHEQLAWYVEGARRHDLTPCFFRLQDWHPGKAEITAYIPSGNGFRQAVIPMPAVVHNRSIFLKESDNRKLKAMLSGNIQLFNACNRYGKLTIHQLLMEDPRLRPHLPGTFQATPANVRIMMTMYQSLIIKPNKSSIGRGIMKLQKVGSRWNLTYPVAPNRSKTSWRTITFREPYLPKLLLQRIRHSTYIIQQRLPLAEIHGSPFDIRVSVQRGIDGCWQVTGMAAKVAPAGAFITNVAQGGKVHSVHRLLKEYCPQLDAGRTIEEINRFSLYTAEQLGARLPNLADLGLDIGITNEGFPLFIECNGKDQRYSFHLAGLEEEWKASYYNPMGYARYLLDQANQKK